MILHRPKQPGPMKSQCTPIHQLEKGHLSKGPPDVGSMFPCTFSGDRISFKIFTRGGAFHSSRDWIISCLPLSEKDCRSTLHNLPSGDLQSDDGDDADDATRTLGFIEKLKIIFPYIFPSNGENLGSLVMVHDDISGRNIYVHGNGELAGVLGWERISALPLWRTCYNPTFLESDHDV